MKKLIIIPLLFLLSCASLNPAFLKEPNAVRIGMTTSQVRAVWGSPSDINTTQYENYYHEQWVYRYEVSSQYAYWAEVTYVYFENGKVTAIQTQ